MNTRFFGNQIMVPQSRIPILSLNARPTRRQITSTGIGILAAAAFCGPLVCKPERARGNPLLVAAARTVLFAAITWLVTKVLDEAWGAYVDRLGPASLIPAAAPTSDPQHGPRHNHFAARWTLPADCIPTTRSVHGYWFSGDRFCRADANEAIPDFKDWNLTEIQEVRTRVEAGDLQFPPHFCNFRKLPTEDEEKRIVAFCNSNSRLRKAHENNQLCVGYVRPMRYGDQHLLGADIRVGDGEPEFKLLI